MTEASTDASASPSPAPSSGAASSRWAGPLAWRNLAIALAVLCIAGISYALGRYQGIGEGARRAQMQGGANGAGGILPGQPEIQRLADGTALEIPARGHIDRPFELRAPERDCRVTLHVVGVSGGQKDFEALVLSDDDFRNWATGHDFRAIYQSGIVAAVTADSPIRGLGTYHFVVSNAFSFITTKVVTMSADVTCPPA